MEEYIRKYFDLITKNLRGHLETNEISFVEKEKIKLRLEIINEIRNNITWQFKNENRKQISRLQWLASMRRSDAPIKSIQKQVKTIHIYELIKSTLPYIEALNSNLLIHIINFVNDLCTKIDLSGRDYDEIFPDSQKIEQLFKPYFEIVQPAQGNGDMFKECYERIENLYTELKKLDSE